MSKTFAFGGPWIVIALLSLSATVVSADTDLEEFQDRTVSKFAVMGTSEKPKGFCRCTTTTFPSGVGIMRQFLNSTLGYVEIECLVRRFDAAGAHAGFSPCSSFIVLSK